MGKIVGKVLLVMLAFFLLVGFVYSCFNGFDGPFLPSTDSILGWLRRFPNIEYELSDIVHVFDGSTPSNFVEQIGAIGVALYYVITIPWRVIVWFFSFFTIPA